VGCGWFGSGLGCEEGARVGSARENTVRVYRGALLIRNCPPLKTTVGPQGCLANKKLPPPHDHRRALGIGCEEVARVGSVRENEFRVERVGIRF